MPKFLCSSSALLRQLKQVAYAIRKNPVVPILDSVLFAVTGNELRLVGSDLENTIAVSLPVEGFQGETWMAVSEVKPLLDVLSNLPDQPITVESGPKPHQLRITGTAWASENEGEGEHGAASYTFSGSDWKDFPRTPDAKNEVRVTLPGHLLRTAFAYVADLISNDMLRPAMACVCISACHDSVRFEATDGHRLGRFEAQAGKELGYAFEGVGKVLLVPKVSVGILKALVKSEDVVTVTTSQAWGHAQFQIGTYGPTVTVRLVDEKYPDTDKVVPTEFSAGTLTLSRPSAQTMLRRLKPFTPPGIKRIDFKLGGTGGFALAADKGMDTEAREPLPGTFAGDEALYIAYNIDFLTHLLGLLPGPRVRIKFCGPNRASVLVADGYEGLSYLLMPVAVHEYA